MPPKPLKKDPRKRILDVAEKVFANQGFERASIRFIATGAGVNLPTIYYYFDSKQGLIQAVLDRRLKPLGQEHLDLLRHFNEDAGGRPLPLEKILEAMLLPPLRIAASGAAAHAVVMRLIGRIMSETDPEMQALLVGRHQVIKKTFLAEFARTLPDLPLPILQWRCIFAWGVLGSIMLGCRQIGKETAGVCNPLDTPEALAQTIHFLASGFRAPAVAQPVS